MTKNMLASHLNRREISHNEYFTLPKLTRLLVNVIWCMINGHSVNMKLRQCVYKGVCWIQPQLSKTMPVRLKFYLFAFCSWVLAITFLSGSAEGQLLPNVVPQSTTHLSDLEHNAIHLNKSSVEIRYK